MSQSPLVHAQLFGANLEEEPTESYQLASFANLAFRNGVLLLLTLFTFRLEKIIFVQPTLRVTDLALAFLPEVGTVLLLEALLVIIILLPKPWGARMGRPMFHVFHGLVYIIAVVEHQFFMKTGAQIDISLVFYTAQHAQELSAVVRSGIDLSLMIRIIIALCCFLLGFHTNHHQVLSLKTLPAGFVLVFLLGPLLIFLAQPPGGTGIPFSTTVFIDFLFPYYKNQVAQVGATVSPHPIYEAPYLIEKDTNRHPNIVLLIMESTRTDVLSVYHQGNTTANTPFFSKLAREGLVFENVYTTVPHTSKALVGILCGMYPQLRQPIIESRTTTFPLRCLPHLLKELGYRTAFFQTATGEFENRGGLVKNLGFDSWQLQQDLRGNYQKVGYFGMDEFAMVEPAVEWAKENKDQPFFLSLLTISPHHPYQPPGMAKWPEIGEEFSSYLKTIAHQDRFTRTLYERLAQEHQTQDTLFILVGDHGEAFGEHYRRQHDVVPYEEGIRVPLLFHGPDWLGPARSVKGLRHHIDILPTIMELLGAQLQGKLPGKSLLSSEGHTFVVSSCWYTNFCLALRQGTWKFIYHYGRRTPEVFHLTEDPLERINRIKEVPPHLAKGAWRNMLVLKASVDQYYSTMEQNGESSPVSKNLH